MNRTGNRRTHGMEGSAEYNSWCHMKRRCTNPKSSDYSDYGGRGIKVTDSWLDFSAFYRDMGKKPSKKHSIDRIDNSKGYEPGNCRWATPKEQARNTRNNRPITFLGRTLCPKEWEEVTGILECTIRYRLDHGWTVEKALTAGRYGRTPEGDAEGAIKTAYQLLPQL